jgi:hypothetical protein
MIEDAGHQLQGDAGDRAPRGQAGSSRWIGIVAVLVLVLGVSVAVRQWRAAAPRPAPSEAPAPAPAEEPPEGVVEEALMQIPGADSSLVKTRWMDEIKGVDASALNPDQLELFVRYANARPCTCGCGYTLAACRTFDPTCPVSGPMVEAMRDSILAGYVRSADGLRERPASADIGHP